ncbi:Acetyl-CoA C-acetyltransferase [Nocardia seriolae]|uniref:Probable acetyl-CoA acetyltransferase n=1 Tax=Nocardia seriolae TaxID=37332 RepID=A0ABC8AKI8_9NOCA|nr:Acetyl-CoA C-acetyltransferase [Nocardia seriolae]
MRRVAIVMPMRTPVGMPDGVMAAVPPHRLVGTVIAAVLGRSGIDPQRVEQLVTAVPDPEALRPALPNCGLSPELGDFAVGGGPGSGLRALVTAAMMVQTGAADVVLAVGAECDRATKGFAKQSPSVAPRRPARPGSEPEGGPSTDEQIALWAAAEPILGQADSLRIEDLAGDHGLTRADVDVYAAASHRRAARAHRQGVFGVEIAPVVVCAEPDDPNSGVVRLVDRDEGLRDDVSPRAFAALAPFLADGVTTAGNSATRTLAASACLVVAEERLVDLGLDPMGYLVHWVSAAGPGGGPVPATTSAIAKALWRSGFELPDLELLEVEETSAVEVLALARTLGLDDRHGERLNVHGGAIALGEPGGAAGLRMVTTMLHELSRRDGGLGLAVSPAGPGRALAAVFESPDLEPVSQAPLGARFRGAGSRRSVRGRHRH